MSLRAAVLPISWVPILAGCFFVYGTKPAPVAKTAAESQTVTTRVKAHLADGGTVIYPRGVVLRGDSVFGSGTRYNLMLSDSGPVGTLPLDSVVAMESFHASVRPGETVIVSAVATIGVTAVAIAIACAVDPKCFGSCPTIYSDSAGTAVLEAEGFSYSIAPLFERRDVDRLRAQPDAAGVVRLEIRNEALETHFINHLELLRVAHAADEWVAADPAGQPVAVRALAAPTGARDRAGRDVLADIAAHDGRVFTTDTGTLAAATADDLDDWIDLEVPVPTGTDSVAVAFRMRNSLLATVLLYDLMLGDQGPRALDWLAQDLVEIAPAVRIGRWAVRHLGMRLLVWDGAAYRPAGRISDAGPVAWKDVVALVPTLGQPVVRVRLQFLADNWRVDRVAATAAWRRLEPVTIPLGAVSGAAGRADTAALAALGAPDERYVESSGGRWLRAEFTVPVSPAGDAHTFFLASQGYYLEWMRRGWLSGGSATAFTPGTATLYEAMRRWRDSQDDTERRFYATRVPVR
jgi:hypothetical protein